MSRRKLLKKYYDARLYLESCYIEYRNIVKEVNIFDAGDRTPLTRANINDIRTIYQKKCREAKYELKEAQRRFSKIEKLLLEK